MRRAVILVIVGLEAEKQIKRKLNRMNIILLDSRDVEFAGDISCGA